MGTQCGDGPIDLIHGYAIAGKENLRVFGPLQMRQDGELACGRKYYARVVLCNCYAGHVEWCAGCGVNGNEE